MRIQVIETAEKLTSLQRHWADLQTSPGTTPSLFGSYSWYSCWWPHFAAGADLLLLALWEKSRLVGVAPLMRRSVRLHGVPVRLIGFIENGDSLHNDFLLAEECREEALQIILDALLARDSAWEAVKLNKLPEGSPNYEILLRLLKRKGFASQMRPTFDSPYLEIAGSWGEFLNSLSTRTRKTLRNVRNTLDRTGQVLVRQIRTWEEFLKRREEIYRVARASWSGQIGNCLASPANLGFFEDLTEVASRKGWLSIWLLELDGRIIAFEYHLRAFGRQHGMRASFLPEYSRLSPGTYLEMEVLRATFEQPGDVGLYDFGGGSDEYKKKWTDRACRHFSLRFFNNRLCSRAVALFEMQAVERARGLRDRMQLKSATAAVTRIGKSF